MDRALGKMVVGNILATAAIRHPKSPAIYCAGTGRRFTFEQLDNRTNQLGHALINAGFRKGHVVAFLSSNRSELVEIYFALARTGIIGLPLNYRFSPNEVLDMMRSVEASGLIYENKFAATAQQASHLVRSLIQIGGEAPDSALAYEDFLSNSPSCALDIEVEESDPFYFNLTSGTTGLSKSYILTQYNNSTLGPLYRELDLCRSDVAMTVFPAFGRVGFAWIAGAMLYGIPNVITNFEPNEVLRLVEAERVTIFNLVPTMAAMMISAQVTTPRDLSSLRGLVFAGALLPDAVREQTVANLCPAVFEFYGMQETGVLTLSTPDDRVRSPRSVGKAIAFSEVLVVDEHGRRCAPDAIGEIIGRAPTAVTAYFNNPEKSVETFRNGWVHTGDLGSLDEEGFLTIRGRKKDMIVTGGQNVYAGDVEKIILKHTGVADCAVFGLPDELWGERVVALLIGREDAVLDTEELEALCRQNLPGYCIPKQFIVDDQPFPCTPTGKVQKYLLVERFSQKA
ncbi:MULTISPECIES: class I adenylate-forming enzyme family protein [unclassified Sphingomonas]|uniref:class I adenylate-forming enzyme family protein n=1 Tax=unclassified Sphingomonas TaxID=196159 RepID=UPI0006F82D48|nr:MULTISPECIES: AMP-binding protein [unclassified Sphingomonas]KQX18614.1 hypothetical protein ASD17_15870 [Sphingomonas sp. Root1294]KQY72063.1 hypothetical protein ASD39_19105 [Sphingomonas sp. Root50]KRB94668.1 hypothetical protein ASE22_01650 [Sphingomonas sp. Root720]